MIRQDLEQFNLPEAPGVYFFRDDKGRITYIGKATSLRDRVRSYFAPDLVKTRGLHIVDMVFKSKNLTWEETPSVLEALILEANLIKKYQPHYNRDEKDDKSFNCMVITKEELPRILLVRQKDIDPQTKTFAVFRSRGKREKYDVYFGPYTSSAQLIGALKIVRSIFPFRDRASAQKDKEVFYRQIKLSPDVSSAEVVKEYRKNIGRIKCIFQGKMRTLVQNLKKEMNQAARKMHFEEAQKLKEKIFALEHIQDISLIKRDKNHSHILENMRMKVFRIEAYDIAHISGTSMVGVMTVIENETPQKNQYRKFNIRGFSKSNDAGALTEVLVRRFAHLEWRYPDMIVVDGNIIQANAVQNVLKRLRLDIPIIAVTKDDRHRPKSITGKKELIDSHKYAILLGNNEAHRFALSFHRQKRRKAML